MRRAGSITLCGVAVLAFAVSAWGSSAFNATSSASAGSAPPWEIKASDYDRDSFANSTKVDNKWFPLRPGTQLVFRGTTTEGKETIPHRVIFTVTDLIKEIDGVDNVVLWDRDYSSGELVEAEIAFFAQDDDGNVWQLGEYPEEYENGKIVKSPLWIHGLQGARAGLTMRAVPRTGTSSYSLGWGPAVGFNDRAKVLKMATRDCVPLDCYTNVLVTSEFNPDEPGKYQLKYYARGVGNVRVGWAGKNEDTKETLVLVAVNRLGSKAMAHARAAARKLEASAYERRKVYGETPPLERR
jgi:hypothetical protein